MGNRLTDITKSTKMKYLFLYALLLTLGLTACFNPPEFSQTPEISFKSIEGVRATDPLGNVQDSITVTIFFKDGDGDLGLANNDTFPPYQPLTTNSSGVAVSNYFHHNYHLVVKRINNGVIQDVPFLDGGAIKGRFSPLVEDSGPIEGELNFGRYFLVRNGGGTFNNSDTIFFEINIVDRALNISNTIQSDPIVLGDY